MGAIIGFNVCVGGIMPRFFVNAEQIDGDKIYIVGDDAFHISRALRMAAGESITVCDEGGVEYDCILEEFLPDKVGARITGTKRSETEPPFKAHVYQGLPKGDKLETVIQKSVECGAASVTTFESDFCIAKAKPDGEKNKLERRIFVSCVNKDKGPVAKKACAVACIGCGKCVKACQFEAITLENNLAYIDYEKCRLCRKCVDECPQHSILAVNFPERKKPAVEENVQTNQ
jgi:ferredoxin